ncbi:MAG: hypothetical protein ABII06_08810 [Pseudomonadota bacterium]
MKKIKGLRGVFTGLLLLTSFLFACSPIHYLNINYRLPSKTEALKGRKVFLGLEDSRPVKDIIGDGARKEFEKYSGDISFSLAKGDDPGFKIGVYEVPSLFKEAFKNRLENLGMEVLPEGERGAAGLVIVLKEFILDLQNRKWQVKMGYEARLIQDGKMLSRQTISGQGERLKLFGRGQADTVTGEIFTDLVNRLDVEGLFRQAGIL